MFHTDGELKITPKLSAADLAEFQAYAAGDHRDKGEPHWIPWSFEDDGETITHDDVESGHNDGALDFMIEKYLAPRGYKVNGIVTFVDTNQNGPAIGGAYFYRDNEMREATTSTVLYNPFQTHVYVMDSPEDVDTILKQEEDRLKKD